MTIELPESCLVLLIGPSGVGKSTFAAHHFEAHAVLSSDDFREMVSGDRGSLEATADAFDSLRFVLQKRLSRKLLTVVDATNLRSEDRAQLIRLAKEHHVLTAAITFELPLEVSLSQNKNRETGQVGRHVIKNHYSQLRKAVRSLKKEGFSSIHRLKSAEDMLRQVDTLRDLPMMNQMTVETTKLFNDKKDDTGPFDIIGDIHGCYQELVELLADLNYRVNEEGVYTHEHGRKVIFVGDLVDRGPASDKVLSLVMAMVDAGTAMCVPGNHDAKLLKYLDGKKVKVQHGLETTIEQLKNASEEEIVKLKSFLRSLVSHFVLDGGNLVVSHAGLPQEMHGGASGAVRSFCMYGATTGKLDEDGLPVRLPWERDYEGSALVVYGHTPKARLEIVNNTLNLDTGCVFGGALSAVRYPELNFVQVPAHQQYYEPARPLDAQEPPLGEYSDVLDIEDISGKRIITTSLQHTVRVDMSKAGRALEDITRFAIDPRWLIYLPPTMSPADSSDLPEFLEHPLEAIEYYRSYGQQSIVAQEKHMGSRAIAVICKDKQSVLEHFHIDTDELGVCYTKSGRHFFSSPSQRTEFVERLHSDLTSSGFWEKHNTSWVCLDMEIMPWSAKAQSLLREQYAAVASSSTLALPLVVAAFERAHLRGIKGVDALSKQYSDSLNSMHKFREAYRRYCWDVDTIEDLRIAPFHILATDQGTHVSKPHVWHMERIAEIAQHSSIMQPTQYRVVDLNNLSEVDSLITWWEQLTDAGGEGIVVKPLTLVARNGKRLVQPALKCRGREYLRIIYGADYLRPDILERLKVRKLRGKRKAAINEFALGIEALERFCMKRPLRSIHECVFSVLAMETEDLDPRL